MERTIYESFITDHGSIIITMYNFTSADFTLVKATKDDWVFDSLFFDVDIKTNKTLFSWSAPEAGIPVTDSKHRSMNLFGMKSYESARLVPYQLSHGLSYINASFPYITI